MEDFVAPSKRQRDEYYRLLKQDAPSNLSSGELGRLIRQAQHEEYYIKGKEIARELGIRYVGPQYEKDKLLGHMFEDVQTETGTSFMAKNLTEARAKLAEKRELWRKTAMKGNPGEKRDCPAGLIELKNSLKGELEDEGNAYAKYLDSSIKMRHYERRTDADILKSMSTDEFSHRYLLEAIIDSIVLECGE